MLRKDGLLRIRIYLYLGIYLSRFTGKPSCGLVDAMHRWRSSYVIPIEVKYWKIVRVAERALIGFN